MFCNYCGTQNPDDAVFCNKCGRKHEITSQQDSAVLSPLPRSPVSTPAARVSKRQDGPYASPSVSQPPQGDSMQDAVPSSSSSGSTLQTPSGTAERSSLPATTGVAPPGRSIPSGPPPFQTARPKSRRRLWIVLSSLVGVFLLLASWGGFTYVNRSTPEKTLTTVCQALKSGDYPTAHGLFSPALQSRLGPEPTWASGRQNDYNQQGGLTNCSVGSVSQSASSASGVVTLTFGKGRVEEDGVKLINENGKWVIDKTAVQTARGTISEFALPTAKSSPFGITAGPDGNLWFTEGSGNKIGHISSSGSLTEFSGSITEFALPTADSLPQLIATGPDGNLWFTENYGNKIGRINSSGRISEFALPTADSGPEGITAGPDGNLWFTEAAGNKIGRISSSGSISEFALPTTDSLPDHIVAGPDGNLWFTECSGNKIGRISSSGSISEFALPTANSCPRGIAAGPDGNLWFTEAAGNKIGRISSSGSISEFALPTTDNGPVPVGITAGPDGNLWFTEHYGNKIGRISTKGTISEFALPNAIFWPANIVAGPDGNLWFTEGSNQIGRISSR